MSNVKTQILYDENQQPIYALVPYGEYKGLTGQDQTESERSSLLSDDGLSIRLPNGGPGACIDLPRFVDYWCKSALLSIPINQRAKKFEEFDVSELLSLEGLIRGCFLTGNSYRNTMQATTEVVSALVATGLFSEVKFYKAKLRDGHIFNRQEALVRENDDNALDEDSPLAESDFHIYSRTVKCIEGNEQALIEFNKSHPNQGPRIQNRWFMDPTYMPDFVKKTLNHL